MISAQQARYRTLRSDTVGVSVHAPPSLTWRILARVEGWPDFSGFYVTVVKTTDTTYSATCSRGIINIRTRFDYPGLLLDHAVTLPIRTTVAVPCRVLPNLRGSDLLVTVSRTVRESPDAYLERLDLTALELERAKAFIENRTSESQTIGRT